MIPSINNRINKFTHQFNNNQPSNFGIIVPILCLVSSYFHHFMFFFIRIQIMAITVFQRNEERSRVYSQQCTHPLSWTDTCTDKWASLSHSQPLLKHHHHHPQYPHTHITRAFSSSFFQIDSKLGNTDNY